MTLFAAGDKPTAAQLDAVIAPGWPSYTVTWTCSTTPPAVGNGSVTGQYRRTTDSDLMVVQIRLAVGSTTTFGTGYFIFSLPILATANAVLFSTGTAHIDDVSTQGRPAVCRFNSTSQLIVDGSGGVVTGTSPMTFANGDIMRIRMEYEPA